MGSPLPAFSHCRCTAHWSWSISGGKCKSAVSGKAARKSDNVIEEPGTGLEAASASNAAREEEEKAKEEQEIQSAIDAYQNLGIVQVSGYVNIRETPDMKGNIIGKVSGDGACEVLGEEANGAISLPAVLKAISAANTW
mgnify:CR=1 FL=1